MQKKSTSGADTLLIKDGVIKFNGNELIRTDNIGNYNAGSATKLQTARTIWGQSFDGSANISGDLSGVGAITSSRFKIISDTRFSDFGLNFQSASGTTRGVIGYYRDHLYFGRFDGTDETGNIAFYNNGDAFINATKIGIGIYPTESFHVKGNMRCEGSILGVNQDTSFSANYMWGLYQWQNNLTFTRRNTSNAWLGDAVTISLSNGYVGIGVSPSYKLHVDGNIYATGAVTCLSDIREKNILGQTKITVEQIASMPSIVYKWKDNGDDRDEHVGSIAQDWQSVLPQAVLTAKDEKKTLSMQYGVAALVSAITIARKVVDHERRIKELENENRKLKEQLKIA